MAHDNFDVEDVPAWGALVLGIVSLTGIGVISIFGYGLGDKMFTLFNETVTWAAALVLIGGVSIMVTNGIDSDSYLAMVRGEQGAAADDDMLGTIAQVGILAVLAVPFLVTFIPASTTSSPPATSSAAPSPSSSPLAPASQRTRTNHRLTTQRHPNVIPKPLPAMSRSRTNPFSAAPDLDPSGGYVPADDRRDVAMPVECGRCGTEYESAREALDCTHDTTHE